VVNERVIRTNRAPRPVGAYSQARIYGNLLFCSGQVGMDPVTGELERGVEAQAERSLLNIKAILEEGGASMESVIKCRIYLVNMDDFKRVDSVYSRFFSDKAPPARVAVGVASLPLGAEVEIEAIASV